jgi:hypothetical protein
LGSSSSRVVAVNSIIILQPSIAASIIAEPLAYPSPASTAFSIMSRKTPRSRRGQRSDSHRSNPSHSSASVGFDIASTHPSTSAGWTPATSVTTASHIPMNFDPNPPQGHPQGPPVFDAAPPPHSEAAFDGQQMESWQNPSLSFWPDASLPPWQDGSPPPHSQAAFDVQQTDSWQDPSLSSWPDASLPPWQDGSPPPDTNQGYYVASSPEAMDYDSPGNSDDLGSSILVNRGSTPALSPPRHRHSSSGEENTIRKDSTEHNKKGWSHTRDPSVVMPWITDPRSNPSTQDVMTGYYSYQPNHPGVVGATEVQAGYLYPPTIPDSEFEDQGDQEQDMANAYNNGNIGPYHQGGGGGNWEVDDSSCTRRRQRDGE